MIGKATNTIPERVAVTVPHLPHDGGLLSWPLSDISINTQGVMHLIGGDALEETESVAKNAVGGGSHLPPSLRSRKHDLSRASQRKDVAMKKNSGTCSALRFSETANDVVAGWEF